MYFYNINTSQRGTQIYIYMYTPVPSCQKVTQNWKIEKYNGLQDNETLLKVLFITWQKSAKLTKLAQLKGLNQTERKAANGNKIRVLVNTMQTGTRITNQSSFVMTTHVTSVTLPSPPKKNHPVDHIRCRSWGPLFWENWAICGTLLLLLQVLSSDV